MPFLISSLHLKKYKFLKCQIQNLEIKEIVLANQAVEDSVDPTEVECLVSENRLY